MDFEYSLQIDGTFWWVFSSFLREFLAETVGAWLQKCLLACLDTAIWCQDILIAMLAFN